MRRARPPMRAPRAGRCRGTPRAPRCGGRCTASTRSSSSPGRRRTTASTSTGRPSTRRSRPACATSCTCRSSRRRPTRHSRSRATTGTPEEHVRAGPTAWTFLRMNLYIDFLPAMVLPDGVMRGPAGDGRVSAIPRDDVAAAAAVVLTTTGHQARAYDLTGRESFSLAQAAELMPRLTARPIRFKDESHEEAFAPRADYGAPDYMVRGWVSTYQAIRDGSLERVRPDFGELVGREPATLAEYLQEHPRALDHVTR